MKDISLLCFQLTFPLMTSAIVRDAMHHGTSSHGFGQVVLICM